MIPSYASDIPAILSLHDLSHVMGLSNSTLTVLLQDDSFPMIRIGNQLFVLRDSLLAWLKEHEKTKNKEANAFGT